jgi:MFS family permease
MFFFPAMAAYATDIAPASRRGEYMGMTQMAMSLAFAIGPWAGTAVLGAFGGKTLWLGAFAIGLVSTVMMLRLPDDAPAVAAPEVVRTS